MRVLIVGAGVAGPTLAHWLLRGDHDVTIVERTPAPREGGYLIDFWGAGFDVAERMGLTSRILERAYPVRELREVNSAGRTIARMDPRRAVAHTNNRFASIARSELASVVLETIDDRAEILYGDSVAAIDDHGDGVTVTLDSGITRDVDLVVGADGLHSRVRQLAFGDESEFERYLGIVVSVAVLDNYEPRDELVGVTHTAVGGQVLRFAQRDGSTVVAFSFRDDGVMRDDIDGQHARLREHFGRMGWEVPRMLDALPGARSFYYDRASQIRMDSWYRGRVVLLGDAAACASLLAGQGTALAMIEAYVLAHNLNSSAGDYRSALEATEQQLAGFVRAKQDAATRLGVAFAPRNRLELWLRNTVIRSMGVGWIANLAIGRSLRDTIELPPPALG